MNCIERIFCCSDVGVCEWVLVLVLLLIVENGVGCGVRVDYYVCVFEDKNELVIV